MSTKKGKMLNGRENQIAFLGYPNNGPVHNVFGILAKYSSSMLFSKSKILFLFWR